MKFYSKDFENMTTMPKQFTADGENLSPTFIIKDVPNGTVSLALICHDPDATRGIPWVHWLIWNIKPEATSISSENLPSESVEGITSFGSKGYGGPSPSPGSGPHRYVFTLYALSTHLDLPQKVFSYNQIRKRIKSITLEESSWAGIYQRR